MTRKSLRLENRHTGEVLEIARTVDASGSRFLLRGSLPPHRAGPPLHIHHLEDEVGVIRAGTLSAIVAGQTMQVPTGGTVRLPRGVAHRWWNAADVPLEFEGETSPAVDLDRYLQAVFEIMNAGPPNRPPLFYLAHLAVRHRHTQSVLVLPGPLQALLFRLVVVVGHLLGRYRGTEWPGCPARCVGVPTGPAPTPEPSGH